MIDFLGFLFGVSGSAFVAYGKRTGWVLFLCSNVAWLLYGLVSQNLWIILQSVAFTVTSTLGLVNHDRRAAV